MRRWFVIVATFALLACGCTSAPDIGASDETAPSAPTVLILDGSGSMNENDAPGPRIEAAKDAAHKLVAALPDTAIISLETYGTTTGSAPADKPISCQDVRTLLPVAGLERTAMDTAITTITASGYTPISLALQRAADQLPADDSPQAIVLVSDGEETCDASPCDTAAQLKTTHPGLTISTVSFKVDGPAADQLRCIAQHTAGIFIQAGNAAQLATRLQATQDIGQANQSLTGSGIYGIDLGNALDDVQAAHPDFPDASGSGPVDVVVWRDCDFQFTDGVLESIRPHTGARSIDGLQVGYPVAVATELYGKPLAANTNDDLRGSAGDTTLVYDADPQGDNAYRITIQTAGPLTGTIKTITLCRCKPHAALPPVDAELFRAESDGAIGYFFTAPTGGWRCAIRPWQEAGCSTANGDPLPVAGAPLVPSHYDQAPVPPNAIVVTDETAQFASQGDPHYLRYDAPARTLDYGETLQALGYTCNVQESGISCKNDATGDGFTFSADGYKFEYTPVPGLPQSASPQTPTSGPDEVVLKPVDGQGNTMPGYRTDASGSDYPISCDFGSPSPYDVTHGVRSCGDTANSGDACWPTAGGAQVLCLIDPFSNELKLRTATGANTSLNPQSDAPRPMALELDDGTRCRARIGGAWSAQAQHDNYVGQFSCQSDSLLGDFIAVWAPADDNHGIKKGPDGWTVEVGTSEGPLTTLKVTKVFFVGMADADKTVPALPQANSCEASEISAAIGSQISVERCYGDWAYVTTGELGDSTSLVHLSQGQWQRYTGFPSSICQGKAAADGVPEPELSSFPTSC